MNRNPLILYVLVAFCYWVSLFIYIPVLPTYIQNKTQSLAMVGVILSMYGLWQGAIRIPLGLLADRLGRCKLFVLIGLLAAGLGAWLLNTSDSVTGLLVGRAFTGVAAGAWVTLIVAFSSLFPPSEAIRATTILTLANSVGRVLATSVTGVVQRAGGYPLIFLVSMITAGLAALLLLPIPEPHRPSQSASFRNLARLAFRPDVLLPTILAAILQYVNWTATLSYIPLLVEQFGGTGVTQSLFVSMNIGVVVAGNLVVATIVNRIAVKQILYGGFVLLFLGLTLAALAPSLAVLFGGQFLLGLGEGTLYPTLMGLSIRYVVDTERNTAMGVHQAIYALGTFAGPWCSGLLATAIGLEGMLGVTGGVCLILSLGLIAKLKEAPPLSRGALS